MYIIRSARIINKKRQLMDEIIKPLGFRRIEWQLLTTLLNEDDLTQKHINQLIDNDPAFITRALDQLETKKLIKRGINPHDKRQRLIKLTKKGKPVAQHLLNQGEKLNACFLKGFSKDEITTLDNLITKIEDNINRYVESDNE